MHIVIPGRQDTARANNLEPDPTPCKLDWAEEEFDCPHCDMRELRWRPLVWVSETPSFVYRLKSWVTPMGNRKITLRVRKKREDGSLGMEKPVFKRANGKVIF